MKTLITTLASIALTAAAFAQREVPITWEKYPSKASILIYEKAAAGDRLIGIVAVDPANPEPEESILKLGDQETVIYIVAQDDVGLKSFPSEPLKIPSKLAAPAGLKIAVKVEVTVNP